MIAVEGLGKKYQLGQTLSPNTLRDHLAHGVKSLLNRNGAGKRPRREEFWALKDVSFKVKEGEVLGVIGRNGAGKSTLLKVLSKITEPTAGEVRLGGRVASLLEVGTGFHPELSGRENIFLNGAILGMTRVEIKRKFDEIVAFAGVEQFIDTPVKRYSSGMKVRLAFAVAAHLDPEILLIDEVLAVGDAEFQKKCLGKMDDVARGGRTILFVSHNMAAVENLCAGVILLEDGRVKKIGEVEPVVGHYLKSAPKGVFTVADGRRKRAGAKAVITEIQILDRRNRELRIVPLHDSATFMVKLKSPPILVNVRVVISVYDELGTRVFVLESGSQYKKTISLTSDLSVACTIESLQIMPGTYGVKVAVFCDSDVIDEVDLGHCLEIAPADVYGTGRIPPKKGGAYAPRVCWSHW